MSVSGLNMKIKSGALDKLYGEVGDFLATYTVGKLPKAMRALTRMERWEPLLVLTRPFKWSPHAHQACTKIFVSSLDQGSLIRYLRLILLPAIRADIKANDRLHPMLHQSLKKALFKPVAAVKGIIEPLFSESPECTLREANLIMSVYAKVSITPEASNELLYWLSGPSHESWTSALGYAMQVALSKKHTIPVSTVEAVGKFFAGFIDSDESYPVLWHSGLLTLLEVYGESIQSEALIESLKALVAKHSHYQITPRIKEILSKWSDMMR